MSKPELETKAAAFEDDDFDFGGKEAPPAKDETSDKEDKEPEDPDKDDETGDDVSSDDTSDKSKASDAKKDTPKGDEGKKEEKKEERVDPFATDDTPDDDDKLSLKKLASGLEVDLDKEDLSEFTTKVKQKIEAARQEFKLDEYPDDAKAIIKHLKENDGKIEDFFNNKNIVSLQSVINLDAEQKVRQVRINELKGAGIAADKAAAQADEEIEGLSTRELKNQADRIDNDARELISKEITKITGDRKAQAEQKRATELKRMEQEIGQVKEYVKTQKEFLGIPLTDKAKQNIIRDIETGEFDRIANTAPESSKFAAYMLAKFGKNINEVLKKTAAEQNRKGFNAAVEKEKSALHKTKDSAQQNKSGHQQAKTGNEGKFDGFATGIED
jgi:hypothetical protein